MDRRADFLPECSIAEMAEVTGLTLRAIRLYESIGLVRPRRDRQNCRRYGPKARERLLLVAKLRRAGLGLEEIRALLEPDAPQTPERRRGLMLEALEAQVARYEARWGEALSVLRELDADAAPAARTAA